MLKYLQCEKILERQDAHFEQHRAAYQTCLKRFENIKSDIYQIKNFAATFSEQAAGENGGRWRHGDGGGVVSNEVCEQGACGASPRQVSCEQDHGGYR